MIYSSIENKRIKDIKKLTKKKYRDLTKTFLVEGEHLIKEANKSGYLKEVLLLENVELDLEVEKNYVTKNIMKYISSLENSTMIGICQKKNNEIKGDKIIIVDEIQDPGNLGTIIRSAKAFNIDTIIISEKTVDIYSHKVLRAAQGMNFYLNIVISDLKKEIEKLKKDNYKILGTNVDGGKDLKNLEKIEKFAIIVGNEGNGVKKELLDLADEYVYVKTNDNCESLNVAVATSIILYELG